MAKIEMKVYTKHDFINQIDNGTAVEIKSAGFVQGDESEIQTKFYRLWGEIVQVVRNSLTTNTEYFFIKGKDREMFDSYYPS